VQDLTVKIPNIEKIPFLLTELEMADLIILLRKMTFIL
jgi:predicted transcriptional regulator